MENNSFCQRVIEAADTRLGEVAMTLIGSDGTETTTFGEMLSQVRSVAYRLIQEQVAFGDRVALIGENHPHWAIAYLSILYRGAVAVPLDQAANTEALVHFIEDSEAKLAFVSPSSLDKFRAVCERLGRRIPAVILRDVRGLMVLRDSRIGRARRAPRNSTPRLRPRATKTSPC